MDKNVLVNKILDLIYPEDIYCACCGNLIDASRVYRLCDHCITHIRWDYSPPFRWQGMDVLSCTHYGIYERTLIFSLKYNNKKYIAKNISEIMGDRLKFSNITFDCVIPVPLNKRKENKRGFNQAALIGKHLSTLTNSVFLENALIRTKNTQAMRGLSKEERLTNIIGTMELSTNNYIISNITGKSVLLIDDFFTTGATALECKRNIDKAEPKHITFITFASGHARKSDEEIHDV